MIHAVNFKAADAFGASEALVFRHRGGLDEIAIFEVAAGCGHFADVDFWIEIGGESMAVIAAVDVDDIERVDFIKVMLQRPGSENIRHTGIEAGTEQCREPCLGEFFLIGPLPRVFEFCHIGGLVVGGIEVIDAGGKTSVHEGQILVREGDVEKKIGLERVQVSGGGGDIIGIERGGGYGHAGAFENRSGDGIALGFGAGGESDFCENGGDLGAFVSDHATDSARSDDENM